MAPKNTRSTHTIQKPHQKQGTIHCINAVSNLQLHVFTGTGTCYVLRE